MDLHSSPLHTNLSQTHQIIYKHLQVYYLAQLPVHQQFVSLSYFRWLRQQEGMVVNCEEQIL